MDATKAANAAYNKAARKQDQTGRRGIPPERAAQRAVQDIALGQMRKDFDTAAQDNTMKYERFRFSVVGEGTLASQENYRRGWERIFGSRGAGRKGASS